MIQYDRIYSERKGTKGYPVCRQDQGSVAIVPGIIVKKNRDPEFESSIQASGQAAISEFVLLCNFADRSLGMMDSFVYITRMNMILWFILFTLPASDKPGVSRLEDMWRCDPQAGYQLCYQEPDAVYIGSYLKLIENGRKSVAGFFRDSFRGEFQVYIHPHRASLDAAWQKEWDMPGFHSQCWMVASGVSDRLDMISPVRWDEESCEHRYRDSIQTRRLVTHELVHVFHGQKNPSPDFSEVTGIDWFVEGLATYVSGQCDSARILDVCRAISEHTTPGNLDGFWTGNLKYGLSGSMVMYIDRVYGRMKLTELLKLTGRAEVLSSLDVTESGLVNGWKKFMMEPCGCL